MRFTWKNFDRKLALRLRVTMVRKMLTNSINSIIRSSSTKAAGQDTENKAGNCLVPAAILYFSLDSVGSVF